MTSFADITTMGVGGPIAHFIEPTTRVGLIEAVEEADSKGLPLVVVGGGSNLLVSDKPFDGVVVRDARRLITVPDEAAPVEGEDRTVHVNAEAGANWDDFVAFTVELGLEGVEGLSGIPGTVGASVVQNIGAIANGKVPGRESDDQIILYSIGGMPVEDVAWGKTVYETALEKGIGTKLNLWDAPYLY